RNDFPASIPFFEKAIALDPKFAMAYGSLGVVYYNLEQSRHAAEAFAKAHDLRDRVSEHEKLYIDSHYEQYVTGNFDAAERVYKLWAQTYPHDLLPSLNLSALYGSLGQYQKALTESTKSVELGPESRLAHANLVEAYLHLNEIDEAEA